MAELLFGFEYIVSVFCSVIALSIKMPDMICFSLLFSFLYIIFIVFI
ncbi:putative membrane protein [Escherichia coli DEC10C]|nr:putative membrane protein [Escherichia coli DEC4F]EHW28241.1 putative membrane protein [Escherichia coli DEC8E]EHW78091.1 putative membrane protein [Escherichia coli DEC10C]